ncbi:pfh1, partial [Symbiodinium sp. KB8]
MQQREAIRRAADAGARPRISAQGSQLLPLRDNRLQSVLLTRPNGQLTRAGQFYHSITGRRPPSRQFDESQPLIRDGPNDYILTRGGARKLVRNGTPYERHDYLPVTALEMGLSRQNDAWSDAQVARNVKESVLRQLGQPGPDEPIYMISGEVYFLHPTNEWAYSSSSMQVIDNREEKAVAFTSWNGHAFFYRSARAVAACDESEQRQRFRRLKRDNPVPEFKEWQLWEGEIKSEYFYTEDLRGVRAQLLAEGHQPKVSMRGLCE